MAYNVLATVAVSTTNLPTGVIYSHTNLTVIDSAGAAQNFSLTGAETPTPWAQAVTGLADGTSTYTAQAVDATGASIGAAATASFTPAAPATFPLPTGISVVQTP